MYEREIAQLERERGARVRWLRPEPVLVLKTRRLALVEDSTPESNKGTKVFINVAQSAEIAAAHIKPVPGGGKKGGAHWDIPYSLSPLKEDRDHAGQKCQVVDCVFHPDTVRMARGNPRFMQLLLDTAVEAVEGMPGFGCKLDRSMWCWVPLIVYC